MFRLLIGGRLETITNHFKNAASQPEDVPLAPVVVTGKDEIGVLASSFNVLATRLQGIHSSLEERVQERTANLEAEIAERKHAEETLRLSEERFRRFAMASGYGLAMGELTGQLVFANTAALRIVEEQCVEDFTAKTFYEYYMPQDAERLRKEILPIVIEKGQWAGEIPLVSAQGKLKATEQNIFLIRDELGNPRMVGNIVTDIAETKRKQADKTRQLNESRLEALLRLSQMTEASFQEITDFAMEEAVRLTESTIGYLAFLNEDESVLTMHAWSKTAMAECAISTNRSCIPSQTTGLWGEAVRQRKPVITNDYAAPNPLKKGYPKGHVRVLRHMNVPIFDGDRIVVVAGVGNKETPYDESDVRQLTLLMQGMWQLIQRNRAEEALRQSRERLEQYAAALESSNHGPRRVQPPGGSGQPRQERVPGQHEPRNPHAR